jgi:predicted lipoprotein
MREPNCKDVLIVSVRQGSDTDDDPKLAFDWRSNINRAGVHS